MTSCACVGNYDLCVQQGATFERVFTWEESGSPVDLTGYAASMQIRAFPLATSVLYDASGDIVLGGTAGTVTLTIPSSATEDFTWWAGVYDLLLTDSSGNVTRLLSGGVSVCPGVSTPPSPQYVLVPGGQAAILPGGQGILTP